MRDQIAREFELTPEVRARRHKKGKGVFDNFIAWALAHLVMAKAIGKSSEGVYQIQDRGTALLNAKPSELTIKTLAIAPV